MDAATKMRQLRYERIQNGLCQYCAEPLFTKTMCEKCAAKRRRSTEPLVMRNVKRYPIRRKSRKQNKNNK